MAPGTVHTTNQYGEIEIVSYQHSFNVVVKFLETGYKTTVRSDHIRNGTVKDKTKPSVFGVGYIGDGAYFAKSNGIKSDIYTCWWNMMQRCYSHDYQSKKPTYVGCTVCEEWHNFQNFAKWYEENNIDGFHLDKDIKVRGNKVYSPETCMFVSNADNSIQANAKLYTLRSPDGVVAEIYNMRQFCKDKNLSDGDVSQVLSGKRNQHKGWTRA